MKGRGIAYGIAYEGNAPTESKGDRARRVALVVGNSAYAWAPLLANPKNDALAFAAELEAANPAFDVTLALDVGLREMEQALETFTEKLKGSEVALLFFAGHGLQVNNKNYLIPIDADIRQELHLGRAMMLDTIIDLMRRWASVSSLIFLDACRNNPFATSLLAALPPQERSRSVALSGLASVQRKPGSFVAFATAPDNVARDGEGANSPFTTSLLEHMNKPGISINDAMVWVCRDVLKVTRGLQEPWQQSSLSERFFFNEVEDEVVRQPDPSPQSPMEIKARSEWGAISETADPLVLLRFMADYGTTQMRPHARERMQILATQAWEKTRKDDPDALNRFINTYVSTREYPLATEKLAELKAAKEARGKGGRLKAIAASIAGLCIVAMGVLLWRMPELWPSPCMLKGGCPAPAPEREFVECKTNVCAPRMVKLPIGKYLRGSDDKEGRRDERPAREVTIGHHLAIGKYPVTFDEWDACVAAGGCKTKPPDQGWGRGSRPVVNVSWSDVADQYLPWLNKELGLQGQSQYRLPNEAEWEYAARAGTTTKYTYGDTISGDQAVFAENKGNNPTGTSEVTKASVPNAFGLHHVHGNVWEWTVDCYFDGYSSAPVDGSARAPPGCATRVLRGGAWNSSAYDVRSARRGWAEIDQLDRYSGFRVAKTLPP